jgi:hypothetical protein
MKPSEPITIIETMRDPALFAPSFAPRPLWMAWHAFLSALFALPMREEERAAYQKYTGRQTLPLAPAREAWLVVGRRGGKSRIAALVAVFLGCFRDYGAILAPGERGIVMLIAADRRQARVIFQYVEGLINGVPMLAAMVRDRTKESITLNNSVVIEIHTASFRAVRGYTVVGAVCDEIAFWRSEDSANPDIEILNALRPAMATVPGAFLLCISSPYARRGALWETYRQHYGNNDDPILVWQADTRSMNPTVDPLMIEAAYADDESVAAAEYGAQFRLDIESYISREALQAVVVSGRREIPPVSGISHVGFVDPSGGSQDSMTLAIAHMEQRGDVTVAVLDALHEAKPPFSPEAIAAEFAALLRAYGISRVTGDRYGGEWPREQFRKHGVEYAPSEQSKSDLYRDLLPAINSDRVELLDNNRLLSQLANLERRTARGGRDTIDHSPHAHDDLANAAAGALVEAIRPNTGLQVWAFDISGPCAVPLVSPSNMSPEERVLRRLDHFTWTRWP